jgi:hypothetical protein
MKRPYVIPHAIDRYIERSGKQGLTRKGALKEILSPRVIDAWKRGEERWHDDLSGMTYVFEDGRGVVTLWRKRGRR